MESRFLVVNGHPDPSSRRYCAALCDSYAASVRSRGWQVERLDVGAIMTPSSLLAQEASDVPLLTMDCAINRMRAADRVAIVFPLWLGAAPHVLQSLFKSMARVTGPRQAPIEVELVVTMDMPAILYRSQAAVPRKSGSARNPFYLQGVHSIQTTLIGSVNVMTQDERAEWISEVHAIAARTIDREMAARRPTLLGWRVPFNLPAWLSHTIPHRARHAISGH